MADTVIFSKIMTFTDSTLSIPVRHKTEEYQVYAVTRTERVYQGGKWIKRDTTYNITKQVYQIDTIELSFKDIQMIKKYRDNDNKGTEMAAWVALGGALGVILLPVMAIEDGADGVKDWLGFEGSVIGLCGALILVDTIRTWIKPRYNLTKRWNLKTSDTLVQP